ncbi:MAG: OmpA family protein [Gammaproteobacteria bacterium]|nr:OmpA family protein [Gammaproteobacteria bacterium]
MQIKNVVGLGVLALALAGCASTPRHSDQLDEAQTQVQALAQEPLAQEAAADDLRSAQARLQDAQTAMQQGKPLTTVDHLAYLAERHAEAGEARVRTVVAQQQVARAQEQRNEILLASRSHEAEAKARETQQTKEQLAQAQQELADLKAKQTQRGAVVTLGDVLFDTGAATLKPGADLSLDRLATYLKAHPQTKVSIEGHTDSRGSEEYNEELSKRRADAVAKALVVRGVSADALSTVGRGKGYPVATNDTDAGRQQNRRVEIVFSDASGRFAQSETEPTSR